MGKTIEFYLFGVKETGILNDINPDKTINILFENLIYPNTKTFKTLPKNKKEIPPWYILKG
jgi:hypothetical protein